MDAIKIDINEKYILIIKDKISSERLRQIMETISKFFTDDSISFLVITDLDCQLEKVTDEGISLASSEVESGAG